MDKDKAAEELKTIRQLMERPIRYSTMSGLSGILAGCAALVGVWLDRDFSTRFSGGTALVALMCLWSGVFLAALAATLVLTRLREKARGMPFWSPVKRKILRAILPPFIAAIGLTLAIDKRYPEFAEAVTTVILAAVTISEVIGPIATRIAIDRSGESRPPDVEPVGAAD